MNVRNIINFCKKKPQTPKTPKPNKKVLPILLIHTHTHTQRKAENQNKNCMDIAMNYPPLSEFTT